MKTLLSIVCLLAAPNLLVAQTLRGSHASVELMFTSAHSKDLAFLGSRSDIYEAVGLGELELLSITEDLTLDRVTFPFVLPNTHRFADSLAAAYHAGCGERLVVTSGSRPIDQQPRNASPKSVHPTGMAVDFRKPTGKCLTWLRASLMKLESRHVVEATEERHPVHFHVAVLNQEPERPRSVLAAGGTSAGARASTRLATTKISNGDVVSMALPTVVASVDEAPDGSRSEAVVSGHAPAPHALAVATYRVRAGDNLWTIARHHGTTVKALQALNDLSTSRLRVGQRLRVP